MLGLSLNLIDNFSEKYKFYFTFLLSSLPFAKLTANTIGKYANANTKRNSSYNNNRKE